MNLKTFLNFLIQPHFKLLCQRSKQFYSDCSLSLLAYWLPGAPMSQSKYYLLPMIARVFRGLHAGKVALVKSFTATANRRAVVGLGLMFVLAPLTYFTYDLFDRSFKSAEYWYHANYWHLFFLIRYEISEVVFLIGLYVAFSAHKLAKAISFKLGFVLMGLALNISAKSDPEMHDTFDLHLLGAGIVLSLVIFFLTDWLAHRKFHRQDAFEAREKGLFRIAFEVPADKFRSMVVETWRNKWDFNSKA